MAEVQDLNLTFSGCGFLGIYHLGVVSCLKENAPDLLKRIKCYGGASAGSFASLALVLDLDLSESAEFVMRLAKRANSLALGALHPSLHLVKTLRRSFKTILPENAHEIASGRLHISLTRVSDMKNTIVSKYWSKDDLIEALLATSHVPFYSGLLPAKFRGKWYIDGGITDNLPQHFKDGETITVSPFSGESDICPKDGSNNFAHFDMHNTSVQFTIHNVYRMSRAFFPPSTDALCIMCKQGYRDTLRFLHTNYPKMLKPEKARKTSSAACHLPPWAEYNLPGNSKRKARHYTSSGTSAYSSGSSDEIDMFTDSADDMQLNIDDGESKLSYMLQRTCEAVTEAELWSCYIIKRFCWIIMLAAKPVVISLNHVTQVGQWVLESLPAIEKTGNQYLDQFLEMIITVIHTYQDKHIVNSRRAISGGSVTPCLVSDFGASTRGVSKFTRKSNSNYSTCRCEAVPEDSESLTAYLTCNTHTRESADSTSEESDIEVIYKQSESNGTHESSYQDAESHSSLVMDSWLRAPSSTSNNGSFGSLDNEAVGLLESEGGACTTLEQNTVKSSEDFVFLDGYETDVESIVSCDGTD